eukprot:gene13349-17905_t
MVTNFFAIFIIYSLYFIGDIHSLNIRNYFKYQKLNNYPSVYSAGFGKQSDNNIGGGISPGSIPKPTITSPGNAANNGIEKFLMMYKCKICDYRNTQMISKVAYYNGMVVSTCKGCKNYHLIADNEGKMDMPQYGKRIEDYLSKQGETVQRVTLSTTDLENNYIVEKDGVITLVPKIAGQPPADVNIIDFPTQKK